MSIELEAYSADFTFSDSEKELEHQLKLLSRVSELRTVLEGIDSRHKDGDKLNVFHLGMLQTEIDATSPFDRFIDVRKDFCMSTVGDVVFVASTVTKAIVKVAKLIISIVVKLIKVLKKFWLDRLGMIALRENEANDIIKEINMTMVDFKDEAPDVDFRPGMESAWLPSKKRMIGPAETALLNKDIREKADPSALQHHVFSVIIELVEMAKVGEYTDERLLAQHDRFWEFFTSAYEAKVQRSPRGIKEAVVTVGTLPLSILVTTNDETATAPTAALKKVKSKVPAIVDGLTPADAFTVIAQTAQMLNVAKRNNNTVSLESKLDELVYQLESMKRGTEQTEKLMKLIPKWASLAVQYTKHCANFQYGTANGVLSYVKASKKNWELAD